jgi:hypothetical protein
MLSLMINFLDMLLWPFLLILGDLLDTDMILGPGMQERLLVIWVMVRNLVNIAFVLVLLFVALYNVLGFGGGEGDLAIKTMLPRIVIGLVLVNFTLVLGTLAIDAANMGTTVAFSLPEVGDYNFSEVRAEFYKAVCEDSKGNPYQVTGSTDDEKEASRKQIPITAQILCGEDETGIYSDLDSTISAEYFQNINKNNMGLIMAVNMGKLGELGLLKAEAITDWTSLTVNMVFSVFLHLIFAISYVVLGIILLTRILVLWLALALSPLAVFFYVVPQAKEWLGGGGDITKKVIKHLISPILVGLSMSMGYMLLDAWTAISVNTSLNSAQLGDVMSVKFLVSGIDNLPQFIIAIAAVVVIWMGTFAAASDTYAQGLTDSVKGFADKIKDFAIKLPLYATTVPVAVKGGDPVPVSPMLMYNALDAGMRNFESGGRLQKEIETIGDKLGKDSPIYKLFSVGGGKPDSSRISPKTLLQEVRDILNGDTISNDQIGELANKIKGMVKQGEWGGEESKQTAATNKLTEIERASSRGEKDKRTIEKMLDENSAERFALSSESEKNGIYKGLRAATLSKEETGSENNPKRNAPEESAKEELALKTAEEEVAKATTKLTETTTVQKTADEAVAKAKAAATAASTDLALQQTATEAEAAATKAKSDKEAAEKTLAEAKKEVEKLKTPKK